MDAIYKYTLPLKFAEFALALPIGAEILSAQMQFGFACIWCRVNPGNSKQIRRFRFYGTGEDLVQGGKYIGTYQTAGGTLVWHLFEI
jgi:hypothetical protein